VESPFRRKKKEGGLQKLTLTNLADAKPRKQEALEQELQVVLRNLQSKKDEFQVLRAKSKEDIGQSYTKD
jgi:hypothetical protein